MLIKYLKTVFIVGIFMTCPILIFGQMVEDFGLNSEEQQFIATGKNYKVFQFESTKFPSKKEHQFFTNIYSINEAGKITEHIFFLYKPPNEKRTLVKDIFSYDENNRMESRSRWTPKRAIKFKRNPKKKEKIIKAVQEVKWVNELWNETSEYDSLGIMNKAISRRNNRIDTFNYFKKHLFKSNERIALRYSYDEKTRILLDSIVFIEDSVYHFKSNIHVAFDEGKKTIKSALWRMKYYDHQRKKYLTKVLFNPNSAPINVFNNKGFPLIFRYSEFNMVIKFYYDEKGFLIKRSTFRNDELVRNVFFEYEKK